MIFGYGFLGLRWRGGAVENGFVGDGDGAGSVVYEGVDFEAEFEGKKEEGEWFSDLFF